MAFNAINEVSDDEMKFPESILSPPKTPDQNSLEIDKSVMISYETPEDNYNKVLICFFFFGFTSWFPTYLIFVKLPYYMELYKGEKYITLCAFPLCLMLPAVFNDFSKLKKSNDRTFGQNVNSALNVQLFACVLFSCFSVANFAVGYFAKLHRLAEYANYFWIGSLLSLVLMGLC